MGVALLVLSGVIVFVIAAVTIGREARRLDLVQPNPTVDIDEAVEWIAERLPPIAQAQLSHDDVRVIVNWQLEFFNQQGVSPAASPAELTLAESSALDADPVVVEDVDSLAFVLTRAEQGGYDIEPDFANDVLELHLVYLRELGAAAPIESNEN
jgi:hypothetical protein